MNELERVIAEVVVVLEQIECIPEVLHMKERSPFREVLLDPGKRDPYNVQFHYRLGALYRRMGEKEEAAKEMERCKQLREIEDEVQRTLHSPSE